MNKQLLLCLFCSLFARGWTQVLSRCTLGNQSYADLYFSANIAHMQRIRERCNPDAKIYLSIWYVWIHYRRPTCNSNSR